MHFTPTSSSWMNLMERFFGDLTAFISEKSFTNARTGRCDHDLLGRPQ
jgi:hypothetical protein